MSCMVLDMVCIDFDTHNNKWVLQDSQACTKSQTSKYLDNKQYMLLRYFHINNIQMYKVDNIHYWQKSLSDRCYNSYFAKESTHLYKKCKNTVVQKYILHMAQYMSCIFYLMPRKASCMWSCMYELSDLKSNPKCKRCSLLSIGCIINTGFGRLDIVTPLELY